MALAPQRIDHPICRWRTCVTVLIVVICVTADVDQMGAHPIGHRKNRFGLRGFDHVQIGQELIADSRIPGGDISHQHRIKAVGIGRCRVNHHQGAAVQQQLEIFVSKIDQAPRYDAVDLCPQAMGDMGEVNVPGVL